MFIGGVTVFTLASLLCGLSGSATMLILARGLQGIGGAAMFATSLALIAQEFQGRERGTAIAAWGSTVGGAVAVGPLVGGVITDGLGWRWIFFVNLPIGAATIAISLMRMVNVGDPDAKRLDWAGLVTFSGALFLFVFGLLRGNGEGWGSLLIVSALAGAALLLLGFVVVELRQRRPMFDLSLFRNRAFCGVSLATFAIGAGMFAMFPYLTLYLQNALGYSPLQGGLRLLPATALTFVVPLLTRRLTGRLPPAALLGAGLGLTAVGLALMHGLTAQSHWTALLAGPAADGRRASGWPTRRSPISRSASSRPSAAAWLRESATPSASAASPPVWPPSARSSSTGWKPACRPRSAVPFRGSPRPWPQEAPARPPRWPMVRRECWMRRCERSRTR